MLKNLAITVLVSGLAALALSACADTLNENQTLDAPRLSAQLDREHSIADGVGGLELTGESTELTLSATELVNAKVLYARVAYDPAALHFAAGETAAERLEDGMVLCIDRPDQGVVEVGWLLPRFGEREGVSGTQELCRLRFAAGASEVTKQVLRGPDGVYNHIDSSLSGDLTEDDYPQLTWVERLVADGSNDGQVTVSDYTQIGQQFGATPAATGDADKQARDADYNRDGEVGVSDITVISQQLDVTLGGYAIMTGESAGSLTELVRFDRVAMFPTAPTTIDGELRWTWTGSTELAEDTRFWVHAYDRDGALSAYPSDYGVLIEAANPTFTPTEVLAINVPSGLPTDGDGNYIVLLSEWSVDDIDGNAEPFAPESLQLTATVEIVEDPGNTYEDSEHLVWYVSDGGGLAKVGNAEGGDPSDLKGLLTFVNRGRIEVTAQIPGNFTKTQTAGFVLLSIQDLALSSGGGSGPIAANDGDDVQFAIEGTFDWDGLDNGNEVVQDLTSWCNWTATPTPDTATYAIDTFAGVLDTTGAGGAELVVRCEYPRTANVTLYDNQRRVSNAVVVNVN